MWVAYLRDWQHKGDFECLAASTMQATLIEQDMGRAFKLRGRTAEALRNFRRDVSSERELTRWFDIHSLTACHAWACPRRGYRQCSLHMYFETVGHAGWMLFTVSLRKGHKIVVSPDRIGRVASGEGPTLSDEEPEQPGQASRSRSPRPLAKARPTRARPSNAEPTHPWRR